MLLQLQMDITRGLC